MRADLFKSFHIYADAIKLIEDANLGHSILNYMLSRPMH